MFIHKTHWVLGYYKMVLMHKYKEDNSYFEKKKKKVIFPNKYSAERGI